MVEVFREVRRVLRDDGVLWLNIGDSYTSGGRDSRAPDSKDSKGGRENDTRLPTPSGLKPKDLVGIPWRVAFALQADGWYLRSDIIWSKSNPMPESVTDRPTRSHEYVFLLTKRARYFYDAEAVRETVTGTTNTPTKSVANSRPERGLPSAQQPSKHHCGGATDGYRNARSVWTITPEPYSGAHFATMPPGLARRCILAGSRKGDVVLDPFSGSGTTGYVANRLGRHYIGTDLNPDYLPLSEARLTGMDPPETDESTSDEGPLSVLDLL
jgi:DNA modification methylase